MQTKLQYLQLLQYLLLHPLPLWICQKGQFYVSRKPHKPALPKWPKSTHTPLCILVGEVFWYRVGGKRDANEPISLEPQGSTQHSQTGLLAQALLIFLGIWPTFTRQKGHRVLEQPLSAERRKVWEQHSPRAQPSPWCETRTPGQLMDSAVCVYMCTDKCHIYRHFNFLKRLLCSQLLQQSN